MAKKSTRKSARSAPKAAGVPKKRAHSRTRTIKTAVSNLDRLRNADAIDPDMANALDATGRARVESLTVDEVEKLISAHKKLSPGRRFEPDPDGSIF